MASSDGSVVIDILGKTDNFRGELGKLGSLASTAMKSVAVGAGAAVASVGALTKSAIESYSSYEQLAGGVETLFKDSAKTVKNYADNAYETSGLSANEYMETVTSFAASLLQGLGGDTEEAAKMADVAITDMSDNANKMGTDMASIQYAYQGFAKQNYTMLDNLKLGYGGTQAEMARLVNESGVLGDTVEVTAKTINEVSFDKIIEAIHVTQERMGITGTTAKEAAETIEGSVNSAKAAWKNLVTGLGDENANLKELVDNFVESAATAAENILPRIKIILEGIKIVAGLIVPAIAEKISEALPNIIEMGGKIIDKIIEGITTGLPKLLESAAKAVTDFAQAIRNNAATVAEKASEIISKIVQGLTSGIPAIAAKGKDLIDSLAIAIATVIPSLLNTGIQIVSEIIKGILQGISNIATNAEKIISTLADTLSNYLSTIFDVGVKALASLIEGIEENISDIADAAPEIISKLVDGISKSLPKVAESGANLIKKLAKSISENLPKMLESGVAIITKLATGLINAIPKLIEKIPQIISSLIRAFADGSGGLVESGIALIGKLIIGLVGAIPQIISSAGQIASSIVNAILSVNWLDVGVQIIAGIIKGILYSIGAAIDAVVKAGKEILDSAKKSLKIKSPSKVFADEVGAWIPPGIGEGIEKKMPALSADIEKELQGLVDDANLSVAAEVGGFTNQFSVAAEAKRSPGSEQPQTITNDNGIAVTVNYYGNADPTDVKKISRQIGVDAAREMRRRGVLA